MKKTTLTLAVLFLFAGFLFAQNKQAGKSDSTKPKKVHRAKISDSKETGKKDSTKVKKRRAKF